MINPTLDPYVVEQQNRRLKTRCEILERENDELRERVRQYERDPAWDIEPFLQMLYGTTIYESRIIVILLKETFCSKDKIYNFIYYKATGDKAAGLKIIDVFVCKLRPKLKPFDIKIKTQWGVGYYMLKEHKQKIIESVAAFKETLT